MCRNIRILFNFDPPATTLEIEKASEQFVRKISGFTKPSKVNEEPFNNAIQDISKIVQDLLDNLTTTAKPRNREEEIEKARIRAKKRYNLT